MVLRLLAIVGLCISLSACERVADWERSAAREASSVGGQMWNQWKDSLWSCRANGENLKLTSFHESWESFLSHFHTYELTSLLPDFEWKRMGTAFEWDGSGLLVMLQSLEGAKKIECASAGQPWVPFNLVGSDDALGLWVLKPQKPLSKKSGRTWVGRSGALNRDEELMLLSSPLPGLLLHHPLPFQFQSPPLGTGLDSEIILFEKVASPALRGGVVVDSDHRLVAFHLSIAGPWDTAVQLSQVELSVDSILEAGFVQRSSLGMKLRIAADQSLVVQQVKVGGPAYQAGLRPQDRLLSWDGVNDIKSSQWREPGRDAIGKKIPLLFQRGEAQFEAVLTVGSSRD
jgi:S1-C subfamily serine protease